MKITVITGTKQKVLNTCNVPLTLNTGEIGSKTLESDFPRHHFIDHRHSLEHFKNAWRIRTNNQNTAYTQGDITGGYLTDLPPFTESPHPIEINSLEDIKIKFAYVNRNQEHSGLSLLTIKGNQAPYYSRWIISIAHDTVAQNSEAYLFNHNLLASHHVTQSAIDSDINTMLTMIKNDRIACIIRKLINTDQSINSRVSRTLATSLKNNTVNRPTSLIKILNDSDLTHNTASQPYSCNRNKQRYDNTQQSRQEKRKTSTRPASFLEHVGLFTATTAISCAKMTGTAGAILGHGIWSLPGAAIGATTGCAAGAALGFTLGVLTWLIGLAFRTDMKLACKNKRRTKSNHRLRSFAQ